MSKYKIEKKSGTYSELLEAYGLANFLHKICDSANISDAEICIFDRDLFFEISINTDITDEVIERLKYFPPFKYIKQNIDSDVSNIPDYYDYPTQKSWKKERNDLVKKVYKDCKGKEKSEERGKRIDELEHVYSQEKSIDFELDVYSQIISPNNFSGFDKLYKNFSGAKFFFKLFVKEILSYYSYENRTDFGKEFKKNIKNIQFEQTITATQLYNPNKGKGLKGIKANGLSAGNYKSSWISETMKISGALSDMVCQLVKVGKSYDLKVFVPEYRQINYSFKYQLIPEFKKYLKGNTPIKIDVLNILLFTQLVIEHTGLLDKRRKVKDIVSGLHSVYQKDLGQNKAVINIGFIQVPNFIEIGNKDENQDWIDILKEQRQIIGNLKEENDATSGLKMYRDFISGSDIQSFFKFSFWYAAYSSSQLSNKKYVKLFTTESLDKFYKSMDTKDLKLMDIINNDGFQAIAKAIRKSTVSLQYTPKDARKYDIRYGVAQTLQTKSRSKNDLAEFVGDFISTYNSETARKAEKNGKSFRSNVRENELMQFYGLLDNYPSQLVGALLASYGFALPKKEKIDQEDSETEMIEDTDE